MRAFMSCGASVVLRAPPSNDVRAPPGLAMSPYSACAAFRRASRFFGSSSPSYSTSVRSFATALACEPVKSLLGERVPEVRGPELAGGRLGELAPSSASFLSFLRLAERRVLELGARAGFRVRGFLAVLGGFRSEALDVFRVVGLRLGAVVRWVLRADRLLAGFDGGGLLAHNLIDLLGRSR
jgi:hypothetical protein